MDATVKRLTERDGLTEASGPFDPSTKVGQFCTGGTLLGFKVNEAKWNLWTSKS